MRVAAELVLIVSGVLIALLVDDWRDRAGDRAREVTLLQAVQSDLAADSAEIADQIEWAKDGARAVRALRTLRPQELPPADSLNRLVFSTMRFASGRWHTTGFQALEQSGDLRVVGDPTLVGGLSTYYKRVIVRADNQISIGREVHDEYLFEIWRDYSVAQPGVDVETMLRAQNSVETLVADPAAVRRWLAAGSGAASLHEVSLARLANVFELVEADRRTLSNQLWEYLTTR